MSDDRKRCLVVEYGRFAVYYDPLAHMPWGLYRVYVGARLIGAQISYPIRSDCEWHESRRRERIADNKITAEEAQIRRYALRGATARWAKKAA